MYKKGASESVVIVATANSFGVAAVPGAVTALIKAGADAEKVTAAAVSVGANPSAVVNNAVAAGAKSNKVVTAAIEAGADPAIETHDHADDGNVESQHNVDDQHNAEDLHMQRREAPKYTAAPPLVTPVPSGGGGGAPASRS